MGVEFSAEVTQERIYDHTSERCMLWSDSRKMT